jgi:hypothetical protein
VIHDQLTPGQRIRLESVAQANARLGPMLGRDPQQALHDLLTVSVLIESYIRDGIKTPGTATDVATLESFGAATNPHAG